MTAIPMMSEDIIHLRNIHLSAEIGADAWNRARPNRAQPIILSLKLYTDIAAAGNSDSIKDTFSYSHMCKDVLSKTDGKSFENIDEMAQSVGELLKGWPGKMLEVQILASKAILRAQGGLTKECCWRRENDDGIDKHTLESHAWIIKDLRLPCIIGVNPHERGEKQIVVINLRIVGEVGTSGYGFQMDEGRGTWARLVKQICLEVEASSYETVEALAQLVAKISLEQLSIPQVGVHVEKPSALMFVDGAGVDIVRDQVWRNSLSAE